VRFFGDLRDLRDLKDPSGLRIGLTSEIQNQESKIQNSMTSRRRTLRLTLLQLHATGVVQVFRRHSIFRLWTPLREAFTGRSSFEG
jgi:hypothetical protein